MNALLVPQWFERNGTPVCDNGNQTPVSVAQARRQSDLTDRVKELQSALEQARDEQQEPRNRLRHVRRLQRSTSSTSA